MMLLLCWHRTTMEDTAGRISAAIDTLAAALRRLEATPELDALRGVEGDAAAAYSPPSPPGCGIRSPHSSFPAGCAARRPMR